MTKDDKEKYNKLNKDYKALYKKFSSSPFFRQAYENMSVGEIIPVEGFEDDEKPKKKKKK